VALTSGTRLGPYDVIAQIGMGGMGEVYLARDTKLNRDVALKFLRAPFAKDPERLARFKREAQVLAALDHPNIGTIYDFVDADGTQALVLQYVEGPSLADRITQGPLTIDEALPIARQIAEALEAAHERGIVHRDLKPANIKVTPDGRVKVLDFGLAKLLETEAAGSARSAALATSPTITMPTMTMPGVILGTAAYMSPEQATGAAVDKRTDIWAFGCVLFEMLTGTRAFVGDDVRETLAAVLRSEPDWHALPRDVPDQIRFLLTRCLARERARRMSDAATVRFLLSETLPTPGADGLVGRSRSRLLWAIAVIAALSTAAGAGLAIMIAGHAAVEQRVTHVDIVTPTTADDWSFALSADGRQLAFVANGEKGSQLWVRSFDEVSATPLAGTEGAVEPFWAPDGRSLGFFADRKLKRIDLISGGVPVVLADAPLPRGGTWNADGTIVFAPLSVGPLMRVSAGGGGVRAVTRLVPGQGTHRWPQFLPDGHRVLFLNSLGPPEVHGIYVASIDDGTPRRVIPAEAAGSAVNGYLLLVAQGVLSAYPFDATRATVTGDPMPLAQSVGSDDGLFRSAFSASPTILAYRPGASTRRQLLWLDRAGKVQGTIGPLDEHAQVSPALSPDGQRVALFRVFEGNGDVWFIDRRGVASRFTFNPAIDSGPVWSPDGGRVVFRSTRNGVYDLFEKPASGVADEQPLLISSQSKTPLSWSQDGRLLLFGVQDPNTGADLWVLPMTGSDRTPFPVLHSSFDEIEGQFSPDGRWLAYVSNESGRYETYIRGFPEAGAQWRISTAGGMQPRWRHDGKELFYVAPDSTLMAVPIRVAPNVHNLDLGVPVPLFQTHLAEGGNVSSSGFIAQAQYDVGSDGRFLMNVRTNTVTSPITIVQNWPAAFKK
jgi:serine/threonine protein kinase/Tol biopolymer transport system component